uniref:C2H2-type domain-containing protein n=1 Tax=Leptobrachium leishanense TaxID=445787 RepID=A0A8C5PB52_9ANUR
MNTDRNQMTEKILFLTLEIIRLVTGEDYIVLKKVAENGAEGVKPPMSEPPFKFQETDNDLKIMDLANMIIQLLSEEVSSKFDILRVRLPTEDDEKEPHCAAGSGDGPDAERDSDLQNTQGYVKEENLHTQEIQVTAVMDAPATSCIAQEFQGGRPSQTLTMEQGEHIFHLPCKEEDVPVDINQGLSFGCEVRPEGPGRFTSAHDCARSSTEHILETPGANLRDVHFRCEILRNTDIILSNGSQEEFHPMNPSDEDMDMECSFGHITFDHMDGTVKPHKCRQCRVNFSNTLAFRAHQQAHRTAHRRARKHILNYICSDCGKGFHQVTHLVRHKRMHTGEKPFVCCECGSAFSQSSNLLAHEKTHTGERPFACPDCGKCFTKKQTLVRHQIVHTGEKPFSCSECDKSFSARSVLVRHQQVHRGEKPFVCPYCNRRFSRNSNLLRHQTIHTREKPRM